VYGVQERRRKESIVRKECFNRRMSGTEDTNTNSSECRLRRGRKEEVEEGMRRV
jgi:hypothetical protein